MGGSSSSSTSVNKTYNRRTQIASPVKLAAQGNEGNLSSQVISGLTAAEGGHIVVNTTETDQGTVRAAAEHCAAGYRRTARDSGPCLEPCR